MKYLKIALGLLVITALTQCGKPQVEDVVGTPKPETFVFSGYSNIGDLRSFNKEGELDSLDVKTASDDFLANFAERLMNDTITAYSPGSKIIWGHNFWTLELASGGKITLEGEYLDSLKLEDPLYFNRDRNKLLSRGYGIVGYAGNLKWTTARLHSKGNLEGSLLKDMTFYGVDTVSLRTFDVEYTLVE